VYPSLGRPDITEEAASAVLGLFVEQALAALNRQEESR
jgi:hypothetical protein